MGLPDSIEAMKSKYDVDEVLYVTDMAARLSAASVVYTPPIAKRGTLSAQWADEKLNKALYTAICEARAIKADWEVDLIRKANKISSDAHVKVPTEE